MKKMKQKYIIKKKLRNIQIKKSSLFEYKMSDISAPNTKLSRFPMHTLVTYT